MFVILALLLTSAATPETAAQQSQAAKSPQDKVICQTTREMGSLLRSDRVCMTKEQWDRRRHDSADSLEARQRESNVPH